jgi:hypothetical protein
VQLGKIGCSGGVESGGIEAGDALHHRRILALAPQYCGSSTASPWALDPSPGHLGIVRFLERLRTMNDAELKVGYNAVMAEYMRRRRAKQKAT